jgi:hypothetical protein
MIAVAEVHNTVEDVGWYHLMSLTLCGSLNPTLIVGASFVQLWCLASALVGAGVLARPARKALAK